MKKKSTYKLVSFVFLSQMLLTTPLQVLADEQVFSADQPVTAEAQTETTTDSSDTTGEDNTTDTTTDGTEESTPPSTGDSSEPTTPDTSEPTEPSTPEETKPTEPTEPTEPTKPTEPTQPSQPQKPTPPSTGGSTGETQPTTPQPSQPTQPVTPPAAPVAPTPAPAAPVAQEVRQPSATTPIQDLVPSSQETDEGSIHFEKDESVESFIRKIGESSREIGQEHDLYASVMIAQAILESASGQSQLAQAPNYNLFGIKGTHEGNGVTFATQEDAGDGTLYTIQATFRKYANYEESLEDYAKLMTEGLTGNSEFYSGAWKSNAETYKEATEFLTGRYATDTRYNEKLNGLIETYDLEQYDKEVAGPEVNKEGYIVPLRNYTISSPFGPRGGEFHRGLDFAAPQGEPIYASKAGTVIKAEFHPSWGNYVAIEHEDGTTALYAHQQEYIVKVGDEVEQGQIIGFVGSTGNSTGSHLHFEISRDNSLAQAQLIDPATILFAE